ncbi:inverse autotransporter beta domain-containing protein [Plesiomonas shigelloides]|uniref:inverse autotransporter beta domain-containing protein n=1 Tax=Plesiomonas shigelloides TaxID=703 RepID=UPI0015B57539|nr:inverse autotransporter beta domain-containing protein [Plesiomonas shigelloides]
MSYSELLHAKDADTDLAQNVIKITNAVKNQQTKNLISDVITNKAEDWLNQYGNARITLDYGNKLDSDLDFLLPVFNEKSNFIFSQFGYHRYDDRNQANVGIGWRHYTTEDSMFGGNIFFDKDFSRGHSRLGAGIEFAQNHYKLTANGYFRLSDWIESPQTEQSYTLERPANGWDIKASGWLPKYPQIGASIKYEKYYGSAELFNKTQSDPYALSMELNWTPIPLLTFTTMHSMGGDSENETKVGMNLTWRFGLPFEKQIDNDYVPQMRNISAYRYDFVERNNNITLEYKQKEFLSISSDKDILTGNGGDEIPLKLTINTQGVSLSKVLWQAEKFKHDGGQISGGRENWIITLPTLSAGEENKEYIITATAIGDSGKQSSPIAIKVLVKQNNVIATPDKIDINKSEININNGDILTANGTATLPINVVLKDKDGKPVTGISNDIDITYSFHPTSRAILNGDHPTLSKVSEIRPGVYSTTLTAGKSSGTVNIKIKVMEKTIFDRIIKLVSPANDDINFSMSLSSGNNPIPAGNHSSISFHLTKSDSAIENKKIILTSNKPELNLPGYVQTDKNGEALIVISSNKADLYEITASTEVDGKSITQKVNFRVTANTDKANISFKQEDGYLSAGKTSMFYISAHDEYGNDLPGHANITASNIVITPNELDISGVTKEVQVTPKQSGEHTISVRVDFGQGVIKNIDKTVIVEKSPSESVDISQAKLIIKKPNTLIASDSKSTEVEVKVTDENGAPLAKQKVYLASTPYWGNNGLMQVDNNGQAVTDSNGVARFFIHSSTAGNYFLKAHIQNNDTNIYSDSLLVTVNSDYNSPVATLEKMDFGDVYTNQETAFKVGLHDKYGNPLNGSVTLSDTIIRKPEYFKNGFASVNLIFTTAGVHEVTAKIITNNGIEVIPEPITVRVFELLNDTI